MDLIIRPPTEADLPALTDLYNHYVRTSHATFDVEEFTVARRREWFAHYAVDGPHRLLVADLDGAVAGYATSSPFRPKPAYRTSVEVSVYVAPDRAGRGVGRLLYATLLPGLDELGVHGCFAGIALPNPASIALHARFGFVPAGVFHEVGHKFGRFHDVAWYERIRRA